MFLVKTKNNLNYDQPKPEQIAPDKIDEMLKASGWEPSICQTVSTDWLKLSLALHKT